MFIWLSIQFGIKRDIGLRLCKSRDICHEYQLRECLNTCPC